MTQGFSGVSRSINPNISKVIEDLKERAEIGEGQRGPPLQRYVKLQDLIDLDLARLITIGPGGAVVQNPTAPNLSTPPAPTGFIVTDGFSHVFLEWDSPYRAYSNHARTRIYRATEDNLANAVQIADSSGFAAADLNVEYGTTYYYWIRWESTSGILGPFNDTVGTPGTRAQDPGDLLAQLTGQITETQLYQALNDRINLIDAPDTGLIYLLADEAADRIAQAQTIIADLQALNTALIAEANARLAAILDVLNQIDDANVRILANETAITSLQVDVTDAETGILANASALTFLTSRVTATEGSITSQGTAITLLEAGLVDAEAAIAGNATAVTALDARVTITETSITSASSLITQLTSDVEDLGLSVVGNSSALTSLDTRVTSAEGSISSQSSQLTALQSSVGLLESGVSGNSSAISSLTTRVTATETSITSQSSAITELQADMTAVELGGSGNASAISALDARVTSAEGTITSQGSAITTLNAQVSTANGNITGNSNAITTLGARVTATEDSIDAQAEDITQIQSSITGLTTNVTGNSTALSSLTTRVTSAEGTISSQSSQLTQLQVDVTDAQADATAAASAATALDARVTINEGAISSQSTLLTELIADVEDLDVGLAGTSTSITNLDARVTTAEGTITSQGSAISSLQSEVTNLETDTTANASAISSLNTNVTSINGSLSANSTSLTQLNSRLDSFGGSGVSVEQKFEATASDVDGLFGQYTLKIDADGHVAGIGLSIESVNSGPLTSNFIVNADRFAIVSSTMVKKVTGQSVSAGIMTVTTGTSHNFVVGDTVKFTGIEEEEWKGEILPVLTVNNIISFTIAVPSGFPTPLTAKVKGNYRPLTSLTRSGTVATAVFPSAPSLIVGSSIDISNVDQEGWNGKYTVTGVSGNNVTFTVPNTLTTPATAVVKVAGVSIPFIVAENKVVMDAAFIKDATITSAKISTLSVEKITGLDGTFITNRINEILAVDVDVINLTAANINGDFQRITTISGDPGLIGFTDYVAKDHFWLEPPIGSNGHRLAAHVQGFLTRLSVGTVDTEGYISAYMRAKPITLAGASTVSLDYLSASNQLNYPTGGYYTFFVGQGLEISVPQELRLDIRPGDILVRTETGAQVVVDSVAHVSTPASFPNPNWYETRIFSHSHTGSAGWSTAPPFTTRTLVLYRPPSTNFGAVKIPTNGAKFVPFSMIGSTTAKFTAEVLLEIMMRNEDPDGDPVGNGASYNTYNFQSGPTGSGMQGFVYGLR